MQTLQFHPLTVRGSFYESRLMLEVPFQPRYVPGGPDVSVSEVPLSGPGADMDINRPGKATVGCSIDTTGLTHDCTVESQSGDPFVAREALRFMQHRQFLPAMHNGMPVPVAHHVSNFDVHM